MKAGETERMAEVTLDVVVGRAQRGDSDAFAELHRRFFRRIQGLCRHLLGSAEEAEDAASEVFLRAHRAMSSYNSALPFQSWLFSIASHYCVDRLRRRRLEARLFEPEAPEGIEMAAGSPSPLAVALSKEQQARVQASIAALPPRYGVPLVLRFYSEFSYDQIAATLGLSRANVATLLFRARKELRRRLADLGRESE